MFFFLLHINSVLLRKDGRDYDVIEGERELYWEWETDQRQSENVSFKQHKTYLDIKLRPQLILTIK